MTVYRWILFRMISVSDIIVGKNVKVKAVCGSYSTAALRHIVLLPE